MIICNGQCIPALFLGFDSDLVTARPMKGTARRAARADEDERVGQGPGRERVIVDLMRNDLSRRAGPGGVCVLALFTAERYEPVCQLASTVQAEIRSSGQHRCSSGKRFRVVL